MYASLYKLASLYLESARRDDKSSFLRNQVPWRTRARSNPNLNDLQKRYPNIPRYVLQDLSKDNEYIGHILEDYGQRRWVNKVLEISFNDFSDLTKQIMLERKLGDENPYDIPNDKQRLETQEKVAKGDGLNEPVIITDDGNGLELNEGWHRTMAIIRKVGKDTKFKLNAWIGTPIGSKKLSSNKIFFARSKHCPKHWAFDHVGFVLDNGSLVQASGHKIEVGMYSLESVSDDPEFEKQNIKTITLPKIVNISADVDFENCTSFVAANLARNNVIISNDDLISILKGVKKAKASYNASVEYLKKKFGENFNQIKIIKASDLLNFPQYPNDILDDFSEQIKDVTIAIVPDHLMPKKISESKADVQLIFFKKSYFDSDDASGWMTHELAHCQRYLNAPKNYDEDLLAHHFPETEKTPWSYPNNKVEYFTFKTQFERLKRQGKSKEEILELISPDYDDWQIRFFHKLLDEIFAKKATMNFKGVKKIASKKPKTPEELLKWMDCIEYGWLDKDNKKHTKFGKEWWNNYSFLPPKEVEKHKVGTCYEQALYANYMFGKFNIPHKVLWAADSGKKLYEDANTHAFLIYKDHGKWFWFEHSWGPQKGIHGPFDTIDDIKKEYKKRCKSKYFWFTEMDPDKYKKRMGGEEFYKSVKYPYLNKKSLDKTATASNAENKVVVHSAGKKGNGLFATRPIKKGEVITSAKFIPISDEDWEKVKNTKAAKDFGLKYYDSHAAAVGKFKYPFNNSKDEKAWASTEFCKKHCPDGLSLSGFFWINSPNDDEESNSREDFSDNTAMMIATKDIKAGDEILKDYNYDGKKTTASYSGQVFSDDKHTWAVEDLWEAAYKLKPRKVKIKDLIRDKETLDAIKLAMKDDEASEEDMSYPIILTPEGDIADGFHRVAKALKDGKESIMAVKLEEMPNPIPDDYFDKMAVL